MAQWLRNRMMIVSGSPFTAESTKVHFDLPSCRILELETGPGTAWRGPQEIARSSNDGLYVILCKQGILHISTNAMRFVLRSGDFALLDPSHTITTESDGTGIILAASFSRALTHSRIGDLSSLFAHGIAPGDPLRSVLFQYITSLELLSGKLPASHETRIVYSLLDMFQCYFCGGELHQCSIGDHPVLNQIQDRIREDMLNNDLDPALIAKEMGITVRRLHSLFAKSDTSFSEFVRQERLNKATEALTSQSFASTSITEIAHRFGYFDSAHFTRSFKQRHQISPRQYRERYLRNAHTDD